MSNPGMTRTLAIFHLCDHSYLLLRVEARHARLELDLERNTANVDQALLRVS